MSHADRARRPRRRRRERLAAEERAAQAAADRRRRGCSASVLVAVVVVVVAGVGVAVVVDTTAPRPTRRGGRRAGVTATEGHPVGTATSPVAGHLGGLPVPGCGSLRRPTGDAVRALVDRRARLRSSTTRCPSSTAQRCTTPPTRGRLDACAGSRRRAPRTRAVPAITTDLRQPAGEEGAGYTDDAARAVRPGGRRSPDAARRSPTA